jgi:hypothetical protein
MELCKDCTAVRRYQGLHCHRKEAIDYNKDGLDDNLGRTNLGCKLSRGSSTISRQGERCSQHQTKDMSKYAVHSERNPRSDRITIRSR